MPLPEPPRRPSSPPSVRTPADAWFGLVRRVGRGLTGRRLTVGDVTFRLVELDVRRGGSGWSLRRMRDLRAVAVDVEFDGHVADRVVAECAEAEVAVAAATLSASAVTLTATLSPSTVQGVLDASGTWVRLVFADGELRVPWLGVGEIVVEPGVTADGTVALRTVALRSLGGRVELPAWLPSTVTVTPALPAGLRLVGVWAEDRVDGPPALVARAVLDDPPPVTLERHHLRGLLTAARGRG